MRRFGSSASLLAAPLTRTHFRSSIRVRILKSSRTERISVPSTMSLQGDLFKYGGGSSHTGFQSGTHSRHVVFVGGLTDGLFACKYLVPLAEALDQKGWSMVQLLLTSSYTGFGTSCLDQDADEIALAVEHLQAKRGAQRVVLVGHSTGCQDMVRFMATKYKVPSPVAGVILQAPVSDREYLGMKEDVLLPLLMLAQGMLETGQSAELMPSQAAELVGAPITAGRFAALAARLGDDDMFSSDLTDEELRARVGHMEALPTLVLQSGADESLPPSVNAAELAQRLASFMGPKASAITIEGGSHALNESIPQAVQHMVDFVAALEAA